MHVFFCCWFHSQPTSNSFSPFFFRKGDVIDIQPKKAKDGKGSVLYVNGSIDTYGNPSGPSQMLDNKILIPGSSQIKGESYCKVQCLQICIMIFFDLHPFYA